VQRIETLLPGVCLVRPQVHSDPRGFFLESYHRDKFGEIGIRDNFVQDNHSKSVKNTLRGLHYQLKFPQAKLCRVIQGDVLDVAVDIRRGSPHFGKWVSVMLSSSQHEQVYVPAGFAHGFLVLSDTAEFLYKCSDIYHPEDEYGILWNDPALKIAWNIEHPRLSSKDAAYSPLSRVPAELLPQYRL
jgi:dTDP-4-dehydrorhamnose 3,5-epimerase